MTDLAEQMLDIALDIGIIEKDFWDMTIGEVNRAIESYNRCTKKKLQERAVMDYALASTIGMFVARVFSSNGDEEELATVEQIYPSLFEQKVEEMQQNINVVRFMQYAALHNLKYKQGGEKE